MAYNVQANLLDASISKDTQGIAPGITAAGNAIAELILQGGFRTIDLTRFGYERVLRKAPLFEKNVI